MRRDRKRVNDRIANEAVRSVAQLLERPGLRTAMSRAMIEALRGVLGAARRSLTELVGRTMERVESLRSGLAQDEDGTLWNEFLQERVRLAVAAELVDSTNAVQVKLDEFDGTLADLQTGLPLDDTIEGDPIAAATLDELDRRVQAIVDARGPRFGAVLRDDPLSLLGIVRDTARGVAVESLTTAALRSVGADGVAELVRRTFAEARPRLPAKGNVRLVLVAPNAALAKYLVPTGRGVTPTVVVDPRTEPGVLWVTNDVPYAHIATRFVGERPTVLQMADRLHTRTDVDWRA